MDVDRAGAVQRDRRKLVVLDEHEVVFAPLVAARLVVGRDWLFRDRIDVAALDPIARFAIERVEANPLAAVVAGDMETAQVTSDSFRYPFQNDREAIGRSPHRRPGIAGAAQQIRLRVAS